MTIKKSIIMSMIKVWVHFVWATKNRKPLLTKEIRSKLFLHMRDNAKNKDFYFDFINGYEDHVHCLIGMGSDYGVAKIANLLKGESSYWMNKNDLCKEHFQWQNEYYAVSVSLSDLSKVRAYIKNQEQHHGHGSVENKYEIPDNFIS
jgi:REP element-mobilizing transposase RayT